MVLFWAENLCNDKVDTDRLASLPIVQYPWRGIVEVEA